MKRISKEALVFYGLPFTYHVFIRDKAQAEEAIQWLNQEGVCWRGGNKFSMNDFAFRESLYNICLTINVDSFERKRATYAECLKSPQEIKIYWGKYPCRGYIDMREPFANMSIKRNTNLI